MLDRVCTSPALVLPKCSCECKFGSVTWQHAAKAQVFVPFRNNNKTLLKPAEGNNTHIPASWRHGSSSLEAAAGTLSDTNTDRNPLETAANQLPQRRVGLLHLLSPGAADF